MKILIFGRNGQVGSSLMLQLAAEHTVKGLDQEDLDLIATDQIESAINDFAPDWLINASAYTAVDKAESEPQIANAINHLAPQVMAQVCAELGCGLIHYSTDYVFDGTADRPYLESDSANPKSVYGETKLAGERAVMEAYPSAIILRTAWVYAKQGANFMNTMLRLADEKDALSVVDDQFGSPTLAADLARATVTIIAKTPMTALAKVAGIYHATGAGVTSWYEFAQEIFTLAGKSVKLSGIPSKDYPTPAPRPGYSVLSNEKLQAVFGIQLPQWKDSLAATLKT